MTGVIVRCPNCGTERSALGECEACHEAQSRYFCTNHTPGLWLDSPACARCGSRFGQPTRAPAPPPRPATAPASPASRNRVPPSRRPPDDVFGRLESPPRTRPPSLAEILAAAVRARDAARARRDSASDSAAPRGSLGGCFIRAVLFLLLFVVMIVGGIFMFASSMFRVW